MAQPHVEPVFGLTVETGKVHLDLSIYLFSLKLFLPDFEAIRGHLIRVRALLVLLV